MNSITSVNVVKIMFELWACFHLNDKRPFQHFLIEFDILPCGFGMGKRGDTFSHNPLDLFGLYMIGQIIKVHGLVNGPEKAVRVEGIKQKAVAGIVFNIQIPDCIVDPSGIMGHRERSVNRGDHLWKATRFKS